MSFTPSSSDDDPPRPDDSGALLPWSTPPAAGPVEPAPGYPVDLEAFSHGALGAVDPWNERTSWQQAVWPWGLGGIVETLDVVILALAMFLCVRFVAHNYIVDGASMAPTFEDSDFLIVNRLAYRSFDLSWIPGLDNSDWHPFGEPEQGDVVVFVYQENPVERDFIKRVIAVPGQTVEVTGGVVYVDGQALDESYIAQAPAYEMPPVVVQPGELFVLGDNRNNSFDSHSFGAIQEDAVVGRADLRYWPIDRWWLVNHGLRVGADAVDSAQTAAQHAGEGLAAAWW
ncbi:MAG: signal peptidase I [Dehalococcoidia bacterium]|nr:signal peptidase I [Dehalococcoidia bacterium]MCB9483973.1 signal peptidase I [Dehalococcoidia bacterium]